MPMTMRELTDVMDEMCQKVVDWKAFGKLTTRYHYAYISKFIPLIPERIAKGSSGIQKVKYLAGLCRNKATADDMKKPKKAKKVDLQLGKFKL